MSIKSIHIVDDEHGHNELRIHYDSHTSLVYVEIVAKHSGDTVVSSTVRMTRGRFSAKVRELGALP